MLSCHDSFIDRWTLEKLTIWLQSLRTSPRTDPLQTNRRARCRRRNGFSGIRRDRSEGSEGERLKQLAGLMTHPENGRFTRTIVNRIWARLMGRGIVHPVDAMDTKPWNEDLLDYLAVRFAEDGYDGANSSASS